MANRLADETSPYLLQHKDNPVDWRPWGGEALSEAGERDVPLLVSIGYSACHWCHVMERESFEDPDIAAYMNERFVCIKVDREERPDVDAIYMDAVQSMTGHGGWPLNAFVTPEQVPFYAGTYFPPDSRGGLPSWRMVLEAVADAWEKRRDEIRAGGERIATRLRGGAALQPSTEPIDGRALDAAVARLREGYDPAHGGWGGAPKFPAASTIEFLLGQGERDMSLGTLRAMAAGGIHDQVGGGFARYAVDATWTVPHFEKMLYDNALLARAYLHGFQVSGDEALAAERRAEIRRRLLEARSSRVRPGLDDKRLTSWNALMISALADAGAVLERDDYVQAAIATAEFVRRDLADGGGRLLRTWKDGRAKLAGYLEDHAFMVEALLALYEATFDPRWFAEARRLADATIAHFADEEAGGFFSTADDHEALVARRKDLEDHPLPSGSSSAALGLLRLAALTGEREYERRALGGLRLVHEVVGRAPQAFGHLLQALAFYTAPLREGGLGGADLRPLEPGVRRPYPPPPA